MRKAIIGVALLLLMAVPASADTIYNFLKQGYGYLEGNTPGDLAGGVGLFEPLQPENPPFAFDYAGYEVTWVITDMVLTSYSQVSIFRNYQFAGGNIGVYEDADFDLDYGASPATGIATGSDGTAALTGSISSAVILYNSLTNTGTINGYCTFTGGSRLAELGDLAMLECRSSTALAPMRASRCPLAITRAGRVGSSRRRPSPLSPAASAASAHSTSRSSRRAASTRPTSR